MEPTKDEVIAILSMKIAEAERRLLNTLQAALYEEPVIHVTADQIREYEKKRRWRRLLSPYYWVRCRVIGIWRVLLSGQCDNCEMEDE